MAFADRLKKYRTDIDMKQEELADKIGVSQKTISSWETGRSEPTMREISKLCKVLDCTVEDLTDTRTRRIGEITMQDMMVKIETLGKEELRDLNERIERRMEIIIEREELENERKALNDRIMYLEKALYNLEHKKGK